MLSERIEELRAEAGKTVGTMDEEETFRIHDRASMESNRNSVLRMRDRERKLIFKIQEALERLEAGEYGVCEECGEEIGIARLKARPVTTLCIQCKSDQESKKERPSGSSDRQFTIFMKLRKAVIPVAGLGTRFLPATKTVPKELLPIVDIPSIQYVVQEAVERRHRRNYFRNRAWKDGIEDHFDEAPELEQLLTERGNHADGEELSARLLR
jgi:DnaK suppressor protein